MSDLAAWLLAQITEDEAVARAAGDDRRWRAAEDGDDVPFFSILAGTGARSNVADATNMAEAAHIARWDPTRVLAECEAKREIVELAQGPIYRLADRVADEWGTYEGTDVDEDLLRLLALPYADRPGYREEWRP